MPGRLILALCALSAAACTPAPERPSVVLVLVDQLRHDAAERWLVETRALAEKGVRCSAMRAAAPWTYPSVISLFSGLYPQQHGANANQEGTLLTTIDAGVPLLPRTLSAAGYHTAAFVTNPFLHESNRPVRAAFEHFDASFIGDQGMTRGHGERVWTERMFADTVNAAVRAHFDARARAGPEFVYVHYIDVHGRREGPERWRGAPFAPSYEAAVRFVDGKIRELYDYFHARYGGELLFVVTSDHGQDLEDDLAVGDGPPLRQRKASLHDFNLRVPFYVLPGHPLGAPAEFASPCSNVDVAPTLLAWLGLPPQGEGPGRNLLSAFAGAAQAPRALYARNETGGRFEECVLAEQQKLVRYRDPQGGAVRLERLFDLGADPRETRPLGAAARELTSALEALATPPGPSFPARFEALDPEARTRLDALGYGGGDEGGG
jgi:arylsulfatase A-like enzyme